MPTITLLAACSLIVDQVGWLPELCLTDFVAMRQGFKITEKLRKVMESGAELMPEVMLSQIVPVLFPCQAVNVCASYDQGLSRLLRHAAVTRRQV